MLAETQTSEGDDIVILVNSFKTNQIYDLISVSLCLSPLPFLPSGSRDVEPPANATQEQYDRWLAFQLAKAEDDLPPSEFNKKHRPTFRRSLSMPERAVSVQFELFFATALSHAF